MKKSVSVAVSGLCTALSVVLLYLGGATYVLAYTMPMVAGLLLPSLRRTFSLKTAVVTFASTSLISAFIIPDRECSFMYIFLFGLYPLVKDAVDKLESKALRVIIKFLFCNIAFAVAELLLVYVFAIPFIEEGESRALICIIPLLMNFIYFAYDKLLNSLMLVYVAKIEKRIKRIFK